jgi:hypothetical protein
MKAQKMPNSQRNPEQKKSDAGSVTIPDIKLCHRAIVTKQHDSATKIDM